jgi:hypothetical protein
VDEDFTRKMADALLASGADPKAVESAKLLPVQDRKKLLGQITANKLAPKQQPEGFTLNPNQRRYSADGKEIALAPGESYTLPAGGKRFSPDNTEVAAAPVEPKLPEGMRLGASGQPEYIPGYIEAQTELRKAGASRTNVNLPENKYPNGFQDALGKVDAKRLEDYQKSASGSTGLLKTLTELKALNQTALSSGGAETRANVANWLKGITGVDIVDPNVLADTQTYNSLVSKSILDSLGGSLGAGVSNADVAFIRQTVPDLEKSPQAREQLINYLEKRAKENVGLYQRAREYGEKNNGLKGFDEAAAAFAEGPAPAASDVGSLVEKYRTKR